MYQLVREYFEGHPEITEALPGFELKYSDLKRKMSEIEKNFEIQMFDKTGITEEKRNLRNKLITLTFRHSQRLKAFAMLMKDDTLLEEVKFSNSFVEKAPETGLIDLAGLLHVRSEENLESLNGYGISRESQDELLNAINGFKAALGRPRLGKIEKGMAGEKLEILFDEATSILACIDALINMVSDDHPEFCSGYRTARRIVNTRAELVALRAEVVTLPRGEPLEGVTFSFFSDNPLRTGRDLKPEIVKRTTKKGRIQIRNLAEEGYTVKVSRRHFKSKTISFNIVNGRTVELKVELEEE